MLVSGGWRVSGLDTDFMQLWHSKFANQPGSSNLTGFINERVDELATALRSTFDVDERRAIAHEVQAIIHEEQPYTFFRTPEAIRIWHTDGPMKLEGVEYGLEHFHPLYSTSSLWCTCAKRGISALYVRLYSTSHCMDGANSHWHSVD